jgi:low density lipoprotein receptor-related protein 5/6
MNCPSCRADQFRCQSGECIDKNFVCDGSTQCDDGFDEANCCKKPEDFQCPSNQVCIPSSLMCDGWEHCADGADESPDLCNSVNNRRAAPQTDTRTLVVVLGIIVIVIFLFVYLLNLCRTKFANNMREPKEDQASAPLSPGNINKNMRVAKISSVADAVRLSSLNSRNSYDRNHITGASSSTTNGSLIGYPSNPPPSPATTAGSTIHNNYPYKHYKIINKPPPPTPCSTDICDESDSNYTPISNKSINKNGSSNCSNRSGNGTESCYGGMGGSF